MQWALPRYLCVLISVTRIQCCVGWKTFNLYLPWNMTDKPYGKMWAHSPDVRAEAWAWSPRSVIRLCQTALLRR